MKRVLLCFLGFFFAVLCIPLTAFFSPGEGTGTPQSTPPGSDSSGPNSEANQNEGTFKLLRTATGEVIELSASDYIKGVVSAEIPMDYETEAIKAQAVAAHTYALRMRDVQQSAQDDGLNGADFSDDPSKYQAYVSREEFNEMYGDKAEEYWEKCSNAVDEVIGKVMLYKDEPIAAAFHSTSSGKTESAEVVWGNAFEYLVPVDSTADQNAPSYLAEKKVTYSEAERALKGAFSDIVLGEDKASLFQIKSNSGSGTVTEVQVGSMVLSGVQLRSVLGLSSANFTVTYQSDGDVYLFSSKGLGHGVGMSQFGANEMAKAGKAYEEILKHYYTGIELANQ